jgi:superfamily I DNA/RNA helicase
MLLLLEIEVEVQALPKRQYKLLITKSALDFLSHSEEDVREELNTFLQSLAEGDWRNWMKPTLSRIWKREDGERFIYTHQIRKNLVATWERVWTVDLLGRLTYPVGIYSKMEIPRLDFSPHVVIYSFEQLAASMDELHFEDQKFRICESIDEADEKFFSKTPTDEIKYNEELFLLTVERIKDLLEGDQRGLPLHMAEEQVEALQSPGPIMLSGEAGSGKTIVITHWLVINHLRSYHDGEPIKQLFVTFSASLRDKARDMFEAMLPPKYRHHRTSFLTYRELLLRILEAGKRKKPDFEKELDFGRFMSKYSMRIPQGLDPVLVWDEIRSVIKGSAMPPEARFINFATYENLSDARGQCKTPKELREDYYNAAQAYRNYLTREGLWDAIDLAHECLEIIKSDSAPIERYDRIACDEVQDLAPVEIEILIRLLKNNQVEFAFFTGDTAQVINPSGFRWSRLKGHLGAFIGGQTIRDMFYLRRNYRSTREIIELVNAILKIRREILDDEASKTNQISYIEGIKPMILQQSPLEVLKYAKSNPKKRLILVKNNSEKKKLIDQLGQAVDRYTILTVEESKGLEWDGVLLWNFFMPRHEIISRNDWEAIFTPAKRDRIIKEIKRGEKNPYGLTYEFNLLHVGLTRCRSSLFVYDEDEKLRLLNLSDEIAKLTTVIDLDVFGRFWETEEASAEVLRELAAQLSERDPNQSLKFYKLSAKQFEKKARETNDVKSWQNAAECYERAGDFYLAAGCYLNMGDEAKAQWANAMHFQSQGDWLKAGEAWEVYAQTLYKKGQRDGATDAFWHAKESYGKAGDYQLEAEAATKCASYIPDDKQPERAERMLQAARCWVRVKDLDKAIELLKNAIYEGEVIRQKATVTTLGGELVKSWLATRSLELGELYKERGELSYAADCANYAASLWHSAKEEETISEIDKERLSERYGHALTLATEWYIAARKIHSADLARRDLKTYYDKLLETNRDYLGHFRSIWNTLVKLYQDAGEWDKLFVTILEEAEILWKYGDRTDAIRIIQDKVEIFKEHELADNAIGLYEKLVTYYKGIESYEDAAKALKEVAKLHLELEAPFSAIESLNQAGQILLASKPEEAKKIFNESAILAVEEMSPSTAGWTIFKEIAIDNYLRSPPSDIGAWIRMAVNQFKKSAGRSIKRLNGFAKTAEKSLERLSLQLKVIDDERKIQTNKQIEREARSLVWTFICLALIERSSQNRAKWIHKYEIMAQKLPLDEVREIEKMFPEIFGEEDDDAV